MTLNNLNVAISGYPKIRYSARLMKIIEAVELRTKNSRRNVNC